MFRDGKVPVGDDIYAGRLAGGLFLPEDLRQGNGLAVAFVKKSSQ